MPIWLATVLGALPTLVTAYALVWFSRKGWLGHLFAAIAGGTGASLVAGAVGAPALLEVGALDLGWSAVGAVASVMAVNLTKVL